MDLSLRTAAKADALSYKGRYLDPMKGRDKIPSKERAWMIRRPRGSVTYKKIMLATPRSATHLASTNGDSPRS